MIVKVLQFGSNWWSRFGREGTDRYHPKNTAYFNSSGIACGSKMKRRWVISGLIRFNGASDFDPCHRSRSVGQTFDCSELRYAFGGNRLLFRRRLQADKEPDYYLVVISSDRVGICDFQSPLWKADSVKVIAASDLKNKNGRRQEALLLVPPDGWVVSALGTWRLRFGVEFPHGAAFQIEDE